MKILALDTARRFGWCVSEELHGCVEFDCGDRGQNFYQFFLWLREHVREYGVEAVAYEEAFQRGEPSAAKAYGFYIGTIEMVCAAFGIRCLPVHSATLKKFITGNGGANLKIKNAAQRRADSKRRMLLHVNQLFPSGKPVIDDNEADAMAVWYWASRQCELKGVLCHG